MRRLAFTLIELMIAIVLLGLVVTFLMQAMGSTQMQSKQLKEHVAKQKRRTKAIALLQADIMQSFKAVKISENDKSVMLKLQSTHTLYGADHAYITWMMDQKSGDIIRVEGMSPFRAPLLREELHRNHLDSVFKGCAWFKAYKSQDKSALLIGFSCQKRPYILECATVQFYDVNQSSSKR